VWLTWDDEKNIVRKVQKHLICKASQ